MVTGWDLKTGKKLGQLQEEMENAVWQIQLAVASESKALIATGSGPCASTTSRRESRRGGRSPAPRAGESPVVFSPDRKQFATGFQTEVVGEFGVSVHEWPSGKELHKFRGHTGPVIALAFSEDGKLLASGSHDASVLVWDLGAMGK